MKRFMIVFMTVLITAGIFAANSDIRLNTVGYLPAAPKKATIIKSGAATPGAFVIKRSSDNVTVFTGTVSSPLYNADTNENCYTANFSSVTTPGTYYLQATSIGSSPVFSISEEVYTQVFKDVTEAMYLWRCGTAVSKQHGSNTFSHAACHMNDGNLSFVGGGNVIRDGKGGWHDAGDYGKYVVNAGVTLGTMLLAWEQFGNRINAVDLNNIPADGNLPKYLAEIKFETDWLLKMQEADKKVHHKLTRTNFEAMVLPEFDNVTRYYTPYSTAATADFVAMLAMASRSFAPYDSAYAAVLLQAARESWDYLVANPSNVNANLTGFSTGAYQTSDSDDRAWAAVELWVTTGEAQYLTAAETRLASFSPMIDDILSWGQMFDWGNVETMAALSYYFCQRPGKNSSLNLQVGYDLNNAADRIYSASIAHGYERPTGSFYGWGCNGFTARQVVILMSAYRMNSNINYYNAGLSALNHLLGRNYYQRSFVTGVGHNPAANPHDRRSVGDSIVAPWPGYLVGGPKSVTYAPSATTWVDSSNDYETNEIAINWNAALIYAAAAYLKDAPTPTATATITGTPPSPTVTMTVTMTPTITMTHTPLPSTLVYDGDTPGFSLVDGTPAAGGLGSVTEVIGGGVSGNGMQLEYINPTFWQEHRWELGASVSTSGWTDVQFDVKSVSGTVNQFLMVQDWAQPNGERVDVNTRAGGITSSWKTVRIPLKDLYVAVPSTFDLIRLINNYDQNYTVMIDNIYLVMVPTMTATPTITQTFTRTATSTITNTSTITETSTITQTHTVTPTSTITPTATITPTYIIDRIELNSHKTFPNPSKGDEIRFRYNITGYAKEVKLSIYTFAGRKFDVIEETEKFTGDHTILWIPKKKLGNGVYHYILELTLDDKKQRDIGTFVVIRNLNNE